MDKLHATQVKTNFGVKEKPYDGSLACKTDPTPKIKFPSVCFQGKHKALLEKVVGSKVADGDEIVAKVTFRVRGTKSDVNKDSDYCNTIDCEIVAMDGASDKGQTKESVKDEMAVRGDESTADDSYEAEPTGESDPKMEPA